MPYPSQVDRQSIIDKAREMIEAEGIENLSLGRLATALGVKAPSLYRYMDSKTELLRAVNLVTTQGLINAIREATSAVNNPKTRLIAMAKAYRSFAHTYPVTYMLAFMNPAPEHRLDEALAERMVLPLQDIMAELTGQDVSLLALRGFWALVHGFVILELGGQFRRGGDLSTVYTQAVEAYLAGWNRHNPPG